MKDLALRDGGQVSLSPFLRDAVWAAEEPIGQYPGAGPDDPGMIIHRPFEPTRGAVEEAQRIVPLIPQIMAPVTMQDMRKWLKLLNAAVRNPQDGEDFDVRAGAIGFALRDYPRQCFSDVTLREAMRTFAFFPSASDLCKLMDSVAVPLQRRMAAICRTAAYVPPEPNVSRPQLSDDERARQSEIIREKVAEFKAIAAEVMASRERQVPVAPEPEQLLETYERALATQPWLSDEYRKKINDKIQELKGLLGHERDAQSL